MFVSVIICTYGRPTTLAGLLQCLLRQTYRDIEILVVDGNESQVPSRAAVQELISELQPCGPVRMICSNRGLTRQRNAGMRESKGDLLVFLDDDVTFDGHFIAQTVQLFKRPDMERVGGITGYDELSYGGPIAHRWHIRKFLGAIPSLRPGEIDRLGRAVPVNFVKPFSGVKHVGWLAGFCMIYRRAAVQGIEFDECLPTYGGEDRDFSIRVGQSWKLLLCGDLRLKHHGSAENRDSEVYRMLQNSFGAGRRFAKAARGFSDYCVIVRTLFGDLVVDLLSLVSRPSRNRLLIPLARVRGLIRGMRSARSGALIAWDADNSTRNRAVAS
jgi:glycosyltransferase involved in cell wall biosynthesis